MFLHIPHSSTNIINGIDIPYLKKNLDWFTDWFTDDLFKYKNVEQIIFPYSRLCVDVERLINDPMTKFGKGMFYVTDVDGIEIKRRISDQTLKRLYKNHHDRLTQVMTDWLCYKQYGIIVDCHSFPNKPFPWENATIRPDICIGHDQFHTPNDLIINLIEYFKKYQLNVTINTPYEGTIIPNSFYKKKRCKSIMIEVNRRLYLNDEYGKNYKYDYIKRIIFNALDIINNWEKNKNDRYIKQVGKNT